MSFEFQWPTSFPALFYESTKKALSQALNNGPKLPLLAGGIEVESLGMGSIPPELDLLEIEEIGIDGVFRGRFMLSYAGDASLTLVAGVSVNPLTAYKHALELFPASTQAILQAAQMEIRLTLSALRLRCLVVLGFDKVTGLTLAFKDDPLESLNVSSSFDSIGVIQGFIQQQIEHQLKERFRRDLPALIHRLSQRWLADMGQHHAASAPIHVERQQAGSTAADIEREPDDSFRDPAEIARALEEDRHTGTHSRTTSMATTTASDLSEGYVDVGQLSRASSEADVRSISDPSDTESDRTGGQSSGDVDADEDESYLDTSRMTAWPTSTSRTSGLRHQPSMDSVITTSSPPKRSQRSLGKRPSTGDRHITSSPSFDAYDLHDRRHRAASGSDRQRTISGASVERPESPILRSLALHHTHSAFATTSSATLSQDAAHSRQYSERYSPTESTDSLIQAAQRKVRRKRLHRLDGSISASSTPNASPQKHTKHYVHRDARPPLHHRSSSTGQPRHSSNRNADDRLRIRRKELDEYFPVDNDGPLTREHKRPYKESAPVQPFAAPQSSRFEFGPKDQGRSSSSFRQPHSANIDSLRRNLMKTRLRDSAYFTPSFAG